MTDSDYTTVALSYGRTKEAALYFDHVIPMALLLEAKHDLRDFPKTLFRSIVPPHLLNREFADGLADIAEALVAYASVRIRSRAEPDLEAELKTTKADLAHAMIAFEVKYDLVGLPVVSSAPLTSATGSPGPEGIAVSLGGVDLIDVSRVSWDLLDELRRDTDALIKLRRLRLFATENYSGRSSSFIKDDLAKRVADYRAEAKRWGMETRNQILITVLSSRLLAGAAGGSLVATLFGAPVAAVAAAATAAAVEIGQALVEVSRRRLGFQAVFDTNPVSFVVDVQDRLEKDA